MKNLLAIALIFSTSILVVAQVDKYPLKERLNKYPYSVATKISIVSFWIKNDVSMRSGMSIPFKPNSAEVDASKFEESKILSAVEVDTLTDLLYNTYYRSTNLRLSNMRCYEPRNAIVFFNKANKPFAYIEICFECSKMKASQTKVFMDNLCDETYTKLHNFFLSRGVKTNKYEYVD